MIPFLDVGAAQREIAAELDEALSRVIRSGRYIGGNECREFEEEFSNFVGASHCIGLGSGYDALVLSLIAIGIQPGDEVLVPASTFIATWFAVSRVGAVPIPVEVDSTTNNLDVRLLQSSLSEKTRAVILVHLYGLPGDLDEVVNFARLNGLKVIEDAAQAHGARYNGRRIGSHGDIVAWSFYPGKNLGAFGDAGAITTNCPLLAVTVRELGNYGSSQKYIHKLLGLNSRLDPLQAAMLKVKLRYLDDWNSRRTGIATKYISEICNSRIKVPAHPSDRQSSWHLFTIRCEHRTELQEYLTTNGIETIIHYPIPPFRQAPYRNQYDPDDFKISDQISNTILSIPIGPHCEQEHQRYIIDVINGFN